MKGGKKVKSNIEIALEWDQIASYRIKQLENGEDVSMDNILIPVVHNLIGTTDKTSVIDLGCGTGYATKKFSHVCESIVGIDLSNKSIEVARRNNIDNIKFIASSIEEFSTQEANKFTLAISNMTFMDVADLERVIQSVSKLIKVDGHIVITITHPFFWPFYWNYANKDWFEYYKEIQIEEFFKISNSKTNFSTTHFHRPLEMYIKILTNNNFLIESILEPMPTDQTHKLYNELWKFPRFLAMKCRKKNII